MTGLPKLLPLLATAALGAAVVALHTPAASGQEMAFEPGPGFLGVQLHPAGSGPAEGVELRFEGIAYEDGLDLLGDDREDDPPPLSPEVEHVASFITDLRQGSYDDVLTHWHPAEREAFQRYHPRESFDAQRTLFAAARQVVVLAELRYGSHALVITTLARGEGVTDSRVFAVTRIDGKLSLTYDLLTDPVFHLWRTHLAPEMAESWKPSSSARDGSPGRARSGDSQSSGSQSEDGLEERGSGR